MSSGEFGGFGGEGYEFENRPEVEAWLRQQVSDTPTAASRFEVLDGEQVPLPAVTAEQAACTIRTSRILADAVADRAAISVRNPFRLDPASFPCPDVAVLTPRADDYQDSFASVADVLLLVEVTDSSFGLTHNRGRKASMYARYGIGECWIVDLVSRQILVHQAPASGGYRDIRNLRPESTLHPTAFPGVSISASAILDGTPTT